MLLIEKSLSQLLRIAFPYTYSEPLLLVQVSCALWKLLGLEQGAEAPAECWELWDTAEAPFILLKRGTSCREWRVVHEREVVRPHSM